MKYNILWFDDKEDYIETHEPTLKQYLQELGFELVVTPKIDDENLEETLKESQADLILMDYHLSTCDNKDEESQDSPAVLTGDSIITRIRNCDLYVETILYSRDELFPANITNRLDGVFFASHTELPEKAKKVIYLTIKKQQEIGNIRGVFIAEAIDIATQMEELIIKILNINEPVDTELFKSGIMHSEFFSDYEKYKFILTILKEKQQILKDVINGQYLPQDKKSALDFAKIVNPKIIKFTSMEEEVIKKRNQLAHSKPSPDNTGYFYKNKLFPLTEEACKEIRKNFRKHVENITEITALIDQILKVDYPK